MVLKECRAYWIQEEAMIKRVGVLAGIGIVFGVSFCSAGAPHRKPVVVAPAPRPRPVVVAPAPPPEPVVVVSPPPPEPVGVAPAPPPGPHPGPHHDKHHGHAGGIVRDIGKATAGIIHELKD